MKLVCTIVRRNAAAFANSEIRNRRLASVIRSHLETCPECYKEVESFRAVARLVASSRPQCVSPRVQWDDVRRTILARREAQRQRAAVAATARRGATLAIVCGATAIALWFIGPALRDGLRSGTAEDGNTLVQSSEPQPAPKAFAEARQPAQPVQNIRQSRPSTAGGGQTHARSVTPSIRTERVTLAADPQISAEVGSTVAGPAQTIAVELSPNENTGAVEAAVVSSDEGSLLIDT